MKTERDINHLITRLHRKASDDLDARVHGDLDKALADHRGGAVPKIRRRIMIASFTKLAAAATVVLAVLLGLNFIETPGTGVAWAQVPDRVADQNAFIFSLTIGVTGDRNTEQGTGQWVFYLSEEHGFRMDIIADGNTVSWYAGPEGETLTTVIPAEKVWFESPIPQDQRGKMPEEYKDPTDYIRRFMERPYEELGRSTLDGVAVEGIEVTDPPTDGEPLEHAVGRMWVDVETELPVRIEIEGTAEGQTVQWRMDFKWSAAVDPAVFVPNIGPDYTSPGQ